jgi:hypothetical protein
MRKRTVKRKVRRAKTRRGGAGENMKEEKNNSSYNASSRMYGGPIPIENPNVSSRMYGGPALIVNAVHNRNVDAPNVAPIVQAYHNNRHNANVLPILAGPIFDMPNTMRRLENMASERFGDDMKWATSRIANSTRDFIAQLDEHILTINYIWLYENQGNQNFTSNGYLYIITRTRVYMSDIRFSSAGQSFTPLTFKTIYEFAEPLSAQLCSIFISYCKKDIELFRNGIQGTGHDKDDLELHRGKLEAIMNAIPSI